MLEVAEMRQRVRANKTQSTKHWRDSYVRSLRQGITPLEQTGQEETFTKDAGNHLSPLRKGPASYSDPVMQARENAAQQEIVNRAKAMKNLFIKPDLSYSPSPLDDLGDRSVEF